MRGSPSRSGHRGLARATCGALLLAAVLVVDGSFLEEALRTLPR